jgi:hypothetical protein
MHSFENASVQKHASVPKCGRWKILFRYPHLMVPAWRDTETYHRLRWEYVKSCYPHPKVLAYRDMRMCQYLNEQGSCFLVLIQRYQLNVIQTYYHSSGQKSLSNVFIQRGQHQKPGRHSSISVVRGWVLIFPSNDSSIERHGDPPT